MNSHRSSCWFLTILFLFLFLAACNTPPATPPSPAVAVEDSTPERQETKKLEAASLVGYDGKQVRKSVNKTLDNSDQHTQQLDQALTNPNNQ